MTIRVPLDFSEVQEFEVYDAGVYSAVVEKIVFQEQQEGQKADQLRVEYTITEDQYKGEPISQWLSFSPKALARMRDFFEAFDTDVPEDLEVDEDSGVVTNLEGIVGTPVEIKVEKQKHWQDKERWVNKINTPPRAIEQKRGRSASKASDTDSDSKGARRGGRPIR